MTVRSTATRYSFGSRDTTTTLVDPPSSRFSERSTLTSFRGPSSSTTFRSPGGYATHSWGLSSHWHSHSLGLSIGLGLGLGWSWNWGWGSFSLGWYAPHSYHYGFGYWPGCHNWGWGSSIHYGAFSAAYLIGNAWHLQAYNGFYGYYGGGCYRYYPHSWRRHHTYCHGGLYFSVHRPYWYDYSIWWDYQPTSRGYSRHVYESLSADEAYDDGYDKGYDRGYENGAEDTSAYRDGRNRESLNRPDESEKEADRERGDAREEFSREMENGKSAFAAGDYEGAMKAFKEAVILDPTSPDAKFNLGIAAFASGKYSFAAFGLRRGFALNPDAAKHPLDLREFYRDHAVLARQMANLAASIEKEADADKLLVQGYVRLFTGDAEGAAASLERAISYAPQDEASRKLYAAALEQLEKK